MMTREEALAYGMSFDNVYEEKPFRDPNWQLVRIEGSKKTFLWIYEREGYINLNVKVNPEWRDFWRSTYESVTAGYHLNKEHWNTIILDGTVPEKEIKRMIAESYDLVTDSPTKRIYEAVKRIPKGHVATYGKIAEDGGRPPEWQDPWAMHCIRIRIRKHIPCFRVVNAKGELAGAFAFGGEDVQAELLRADGVEVINGRVNLEKYGIKCCQWQAPRDLNACMIDQRESGKITFLYSRWNSMKRRNRETIHCTVTLWIRSCR